MLFASDTQLVNQGILSIIFGAFIAGVLLTFTPCVLPMIPILSSIIAGQGEEISKAKAVSLSLFYVLGTAVTYALMGALAGATGEQLQSYFQNVWAVGAMVIIFIIMALSMFGLYNIELPSFIQSRLNSKSHNIKGGSASMVFLLGMVSALIIGACVSPMLISFLGVAISNGDPFLGAITMFSMALGMGVPLVILGLGAGHILPKAGAWMDKIKYFFGVMLLGVAIYLFNTLDLVSPLFPWGIFLVIIAIYLGAMDAINEPFNGWGKLQKGAGVVMLIWGTLLLVGAGYGESNPLAPLPKASTITVSNGDTPEHKKATPFTTIKSLDELESKKEEAEDTEKLLVIYFYTDWCPVCAKLKRTTFADSRVMSELKRNYVAVQVNMTDKENEKTQAIKKKFNIFGPPALVFFDREGEELKDENVYGYQEPDEFFDYLEIIAEE
jgi:thiol:disulfide interchange protein DsbD